MTDARLQPRTRLFLIRGGPAALAVAAVLIVRFALGGDPSETVAASLGRETVSTVVPTTMTGPAREPAVARASSSGTVTSVTAPREEPAEPCSGDAVVVTTETDSPSYPPGATVTAHGTARNVSDEECGLAGPTHWVFTDSTGRVGIEVTSADLRAEGAPGDGLAPGQSRTWTFGWNQRGVTQGGSGELEQVPPGQYSVTVIWGSVARGSASFEVQG